MVRTRSLRVSLNLTLTGLLLLGPAAISCLGETGAHVVDSATGCCVFKRFATAQEALAAPPCTCSCDDAGVCTVAQPMGPSTLYPPCAEGPPPRITVDLSCETRR